MRFKIETDHPFAERKYAVSDTHSQFPIHLCYQTDYWDMAVIYCTERNKTDGRQHLASFHRVEHHDWSHRLSVTKR